MGQNGNGFFELIDSGINSSCFEIQLSAIELHENRSRNCSVDTIDPAISVTSSEVSTLTDLTADRSSRQMAAFYISSFVTTNDVHVTGILTGRFLTFRRMREMLAFTSSDRKFCGTNVFLGSSECNLSVYVNATKLQQSSTRVRQRYI